MRCSCDLLRAVAADVHCDTSPVAASVVVEGAEAAGRLGRLRTEVILVRRAEVSPDMGTGERMPCF